MSYTTTITFPTQPINNEGDTIQLILQFTHDATGSNRSWNAYDKGMKVEKWGSLEMSYDIEEALLVPSTLGLELSDKDGELDSLFFGSDSVALSTDKQAKVTIKVNGSNKFIGHCIEDSIEYDSASYRCKFDAAPKTDVINKRMVYDEDGNALNPFSLLSSHKYGIVDILEYVFGLVNSSIIYPSSLTIIHDWEFQGKRNTNACFLNDIVFTELLQDVDPLFFDNSYGISNCGDVLKKLAIDWCAFTGMISYDKAFFKKLFHYDAGNAQSVDVWSHKKGYRYGLIDYVKYTTGITDPNEPYEEGVFTELEDRYLSRKSLPGFFLNAGTSSGTNIAAFINRSNHFVFDHGSTISNHPSEGDVYSNNGSQFTVVGTPYADGSVSTRLTTKRTSGVNAPDASGTLTKVSGTGDATISYSSYGDANATSPNSYAIHQARDAQFFSNDFKNSGALSAKFWYNYRGNIQNCRVDKFTLKGIDYDFLKDFVYDGSKFQPIQLKIHYSQNISDCEAIYLGEV